MNETKDFQLNVALREEVNWLEDMLGQVAFDECPKYECFFFCEGKGKCLRKNVINVYWGIYVLSN